jgi:hypothetical protein
MKRFKIVQHFTDASDHMFRIYERRNFFFWQWVTSFSTIEKCNHHIACILEKEERDRQKVKNTPADKVIAYV